jgi:hypothetical protein
MPWIDYGDYARNQSDWAHSLLKKATKSDPATAEDLAGKARQAMHRVTTHLKPADRTDALEQA